MAIALGVTATVGTQAATAQGDGPRPERPAAETAGPETAGPEAAGPETTVGPNGVVSGAAKTRPGSSTLPSAPGGAVAPVLSSNPEDAPDPFVLSVDPQYCPTAGTPPAACYLAYTTQVPIPPFGWLFVPLWRSTDLTTWHLADDVSGLAMTSLAPWVEPGYHWAPSVLYRPANPVGSRYVMWYTARRAGTTLQCLGVATASTPLGPFVDTATAPAYCQSRYGGTIDASPFVDDDGTAYLLYKSESPAKIWISRLTADGRALVGGTERSIWSPSKATGDGTVVEGPTMVRESGQLYLFYSTDSWWTGAYRVGVVTCSTVAGPCTGVYSNAVLASRGAMVGPGGQTPFRDQSGAWQMVFHAWTDSAVGYPAGARSLRLLPLTFAGGLRIG